MLKKIFFVASLLILISILGIVSFSHKQLTLPLNIIAESETYTVQKGSSLKRVLSDFQSNGWISDSRIHEIWFRINKATNIQRGEYEINKGETSEEIISKMILGKKTLRSIQFIEGKSFADNIDRLNNNEHLKHTIKGLSFFEIVRLVDPELEHYEGWFFPDTYLFETGTTDVEILKLSYAAMKNILNEQWNNRSSESVVGSPYEALILASIIEKETGAAFERPKISGVFTLRLKKGMRLQTDPTVIYGLGEDFNGNLTRKDLRKDTIYNTYTRKGLPPTPIANSGEKAIEAALNPTLGTEVFFVAKGDGTHHFSTTLKEHNNAVIKYQRYGRRRDDYQSAPSVEPTQ